MRVSVKSESTIRPECRTPTIRSLKRAATPQHKREEKETAVKKAKKKEELEHTRLSTQHYPHVFVGNLEHSVTEEQLRNIFSECGIIVRVEIRCSRGQGVTISVPIPKERRSPRDRRYASVEFLTHKATRLALRFHGTEIDGTKIVVCRTPADLPEVQDIIANRLKNLCEYEGLSPPLQRNSEWKGPS